MNIIINFLNIFLKYVNRKIKGRKSWVILAGCFGFIFGLLAHSFFPQKLDFEFFWIYNLLLFFAVLAILFWKNNLARLLLIGAFFLILGVVRFDMGIEENKVLQKYWGKEVRIIGSVCVEPIIKIDKQQLVVEPIKINGREFEGRSKILLSTNLYPQYGYGDKLEIDCKLQKPKQFEDFDYARYLSIQNIYGLCYWPNTQKSTEKNTEEHRAISILLGVKNFVIQKINQNLHEPFASFLAGLVVGARNAIPDDLLQNFQRTGTTHIIAISGWNITFLGLIFLPVLFHLHISRRPAFYIMLGVIFIFVFLVGAQASVVRAGIMGSLGLYAMAFGRYNNAGRALLYSMVLMFALNSHIVYDVGFWLSASATFGLIYFSPLVNEFLHLDKIKIMLVRENLQTTISAVIFTLPISMFVFGNISLWALPVNIIILPFIAYAIILALLAMPALILLPQFFSQLAILPSAAILNFIVKIINLFGSIKFGYLSFEISFWLMLAFYGGLIWIIYANKTNKTKSIR